jgi:CBS domain-containing protein
LDFLFIARVSLLFANRALLFVFFIWFLSITSACFIHVQAFKEIQKLLNKTHGKTVGEVMTPSPLVVREMTNLEDAAKVLLDTKFRRLPVVDDTGKLVGLLTRGNVVRAALEMKRAAVKTSSDGN